MRLSHWLSLSVVAAAIAAAPSPAVSAPILGAVAVSSPQGENPGFPLVDIISQSGLSAGYVSGVTDFSTFTGSTTHTGLAGAGFTATESDGPQQFTFDLGTLTAIQSIAIWNTSSVGAVTTIRVLADDDNDFSNGTSALLVAPSILGAAGPAHVFGFAAATTRYVHVEGLASLQPPDFYGLGEVAFEQASVPEPGTLFLLGSGLLGLARVRARQRR
jgi:hypothetical protein